MLSQLLTSRAQNLSGGDTLRNNSIKIGHQGEPWGDLASSEEGLVKRQRGGASSKLRRALEGVPADVLGSDFQQGNYKEIINAFHLCHIVSFSALWKLIRIFSGKNSSARGIGIKDCFLSSLMMLKLYPQPSIHTITKLNT